jgi:hypothetical protein
MQTRFVRLASALALAGTIALPGAATAADAARPTPVVDWQTHLSHMQAMPGPFGLHVVECIAMHGSMAGQLGPNGAMVEMMGGMVR